MSERKIETWVAGWTSLISNLFLTCIKVTVGVLFGSHALIADGIHNGADVVASGAALGAMRVANIPADKDHPYGHGKAEVIASGVVGLLLAMAGLYIFIRGVQSLFQPPSVASLLTLGAAFVSLLWKQVLYVYTIRIGKKYNSKGLLATAYDHLSDVYSSIATVSGLIVAMVGKYIHVSYLAYGDSIAGILVSLFILKIAYEMGTESMDALMEKSVSEEQLASYRELILNVPEVKRIDKIRARELGHYVLIDVRLSVPAGLSIQEGHDISRGIKSTVIGTRSEVKEVLIHLNPWYE